MTNEAAPQTPVHIGYIVDGNRRWAKKHGLPAYEGHLAGYNALKDVALETLNQGVRYMSAYIFSTENWKRSSDEVQRLMGLTLRLVKADLPLFHQHNVRMRFIGSRENVDPKLVKAIEHAEAETAANTGGDLILCFNYGGQLEITDAVNKIVQSGISAEDITEDVVAEHLYAPDVPPVDLVVRTSGEERLSNFMLWRAAYSEFMFLQKPWPEMTKDDVGIIMKEYAKRQRRFGS
jgi:undecaprenyl diphosphate synthase